MILSQREVRAAVDAGEIVFDPPLEERQFGEASVDLRLGFHFTQLQKIPGLTISVAKGPDAVAKTGMWVDQILDKHDEFGKRQNLTLLPREFVLALTYERISIPKNLIAMVQGRSTYARVGLSMHQTAPWIQPGWVGPIVLEMMNNGPINIQLTPMIDKPCQITFFQLTSELDPKEAYGSRPTDVFQDQEHPFKGTAQGE